LEPLLTAEQVMKPGPFSPGFIEMELVDESRPTPENGDYEGADDRTFPTVVWFPTTDTTEDSSGWVENATPALEGGPWPLVVYNHGFMSNNHENDDLAALLATRGYVVVAAEFPLTNTLAPGQPNAADVINQPEDVSFVIDEILTMNQGAEGALKGLIDAERIGLMGVSMGALTSMVTAFFGNYQDPRVKAVAGAATPTCYLPDGAFDDVAMPVMFLHGTLDDLVYYEQNAPPAFEAAQPPKYLVTLDGATHTALAGLALGMVEQFDDFKNPDWIGCTSMASNESITAEALAAMSEAFGGKDFDTALAECPAPCAFADDFPPAMKAAREIELLYLTLVSFTEAYLGEKSGYVRYLKEGLGPGNDDVTVLSDTDL